METRGYKNFPNYSKMSLPFLASSHGRDSLSVRRYTRIVPYSPVYGGREERGGDGGGRDQDVDEEQDQ